MGTNRVSRAAVRQGSSLFTSRLGIGSPGPVATIVPPCTAWLSIAVGGRYKPTLVRSSPSSIRTRTRSPTTSSSLVPFLMLQDNRQTSGFSLHLRGGHLVRLFLDQSRSHELHDAGEAETPRHEDQSAKQQGSRHHPRPVDEMRP